MPNLGKRRFKYDKLTLSKALFMSRLSKHRGRECRLASWMMFVTNLMLVGVNQGGDYQGNLSANNLLNNLRSLLRTEMGRRF